MAVLALRNYSRPSVAGPSKGKRLTISDDEARYLIGRYYPRDGASHDKSRFEKQWFVSLCYYMGLQGGALTSFIAGLEDPAPQPWIKKHVVNYLVPMVTRQVSKLTSSPPAWSVLPKSPAVVDQQASKVGEKLLYHWEHDLDLGAVRQEIALWMVLCGTCLARVDWDPWARGVKKTYLDTRGQPLPSDWIQQNPQAKEYLDQSGSFEARGVGDIQVTVRSPFSVFVPNYASTSRRAPWLLEADTEPIEDLYNKYRPELVDQVQPELDQSIHGSFARRIKNLVARYGFGNSMESRESSEVALVKILWLPPSEILPEGRKIVMAGDVVLENIPHPYADLGIRFPYAKFDYLPVPGRWWSMSMVEHLLDSQRELNKQRSMLLEDIEYMGRPKWKNPSGNGLNTIVLGGVGEILEYDRTVGEPTQIETKVNPALYEVGAGMCTGDMQMIGGQQDVSMAKPAPGARSGVAISLLQEQDDRLIAPAVRSFERGFGQLGRMMLRLGARHYDEPRLIGLTGEGRLQDARMFLGQDLRENDNAVVIPGSMAPRSKAAEQQKILEVLQIPGIVNLADPRERRIVMRAMEIGQSDGIFDAFLAHCRRARQENEMFLRRNPAQGNPIVGEFDDDAAHLQEHLLALTGDDFENLDVFSQEAFKAHVRKHQERMQQAMMMQMQMAEAQKGGPGEKGQPSQPRQSQPTPGQKPKQDAA